MSLEYLHFFSKYLIEPINLIPIPFLLITLLPLHSFSTKQEREESIYKTINDYVPPPLSVDSTIQLQKIQTELNFNTCDMDLYFDSVLGNKLISLNTGNARLFDHLKRVIYHFETCNNVKHSKLLQK